jgi:hypothetical protein
MAPAQQTKGCNNMLDIVEVDEFPAPVRKGGKRQSEEVTAIIENLKTGNGFKIANVGGDKAFNTLQQKIRSAAKKAGIKVTISHQGDDLFFQDKEAYLAAKAAKETN